MHAETLHQHEWRLFLQGQNHHGEAICQRWTCDPWAKLPSSCSFLWALQFLSLLPWRRAQYRCKICDRMRCDGKWIDFVAPGLPPWCGPKHGSLILDSSYGKGQNTRKFVSILFLQDSEIASLWWLNFICIRDMYLLFWDRFFCLLISRSVSYRSLRSSLAEAHRSSSKDWSSNECQWGWLSTLKWIFHDFSTFLSLWNCFCQVH